MGSGSGLSHNIWHTPSSRRCWKLYPAHHQQLSALQVSQAGKVNCTSCSITCNTVAACLWLALLGE